MSILGSLTVRMSANKSKITSKSLQGGVV